MDDQKIAQLMKQRAARDAILSQMRNAETANGMTAARQFIEVF
jgi:hypothetical protein